jgi:voltage-gated potassium channel
MAEPESSRVGSVRTRLGVVRRPHVLDRRMEKFLRSPPSIRLAAGAIVSATTLVVVGAGFLMWLLDHSEYPTVWVGMWWALQTVTTVGYGDVTPHHTIGRVIGAFVMLQGIAFLSIVTAAVTSTFVARAERERALADAAESEAQEARLDARFDELDQHLERIEAALRDLASR